jgi:hypothetical protein
MQKGDQISRDIHEKLAKDLFNATWGLLDKKERSPEDEVRMIHSAHASRYHWGEIGEPLQFERGEWQISRVYSVLEMPEAALFHAKECLRICEANEIAGFDIAFAHEAMSRAYSIAGESILAEKYYEKAKETGTKIEDEGTRNYFMGELETIKL